MFKPVSNYVLIKPESIPDTTPSGILLPEASKDKPNQGEVIAVGEGQYTFDGTQIPVMVNVGDRVLFPKYSGTELKFEGEKYLIMRDADLFGIFK